MANFSRTDLDFLFQQILIAEGDSAAQQGGTFDILPTLVSSPLLPEGLRNVNGSYNNLFPGQSLYGAADQLFPRLLTPNFLPAGPATFDVGPLTIGDPTSYLQTSGFVFDSKPRTVSNLIVDQTDNNPAAVAAAAATTGSVSDVDGKGTFFIPNVTPDAGLSPPYNSWFTLFGQFFDHGLDLVNKGQSGTIFIPLEADDPLITHGPDGIAGTGDEVLPQNAFMAVTRVTNGPGPDNIMGTADDDRNHVNQTTPFVDQNQTYTSHPSHQVFLREYETSLTGQTVATGKLLEGSATGDGLATWADVKAQAHSMLGINLTDVDLTNLPLLATDTYGKFIPGPNGFAQIVTAGGLVEGDPSVNGGLGIDVPLDVVRTGHAFLDDIAHNAAPRGSNGAMKTPDADNIINSGPVASGEYDDELLDAHFITGDGRGNENIGLTTVHTVFHAEHNRSVDFVKGMINDAISAGDTGLITQWKLPDGSWNGERLFQAARFATEMQYQHLVFEEFARKVQPNVDPFIGYDSTIDPAIMAEFAHVVYRFGHSMLTETVARTNADGSPNDIGLIEAFLNPVSFRGNTYANNIEAAGAVVNGMTAQVGNEIDEFVTGALRNNLVGLPLDLASINIARGRDAGIPGLNDARRMFYEDTGHNSALLPYESWADFGANIRHPESLTNFVAAYGTHPSILAATTLADKRAAAELLVNGGPGASADRDDFMNSTGDWANTSLGEVITGLDDVDFWIGGLAENQAPFGGLLGSTFNFVFETQMEKLQDADRLYYLSRTAGLDFLAELEVNSFSELIMRNLPDVKHLPFDSFSTPTYTFEMSAQNPSGPILNDPDTPYNETALLIRDNSIGTNTVRYNGSEHIVMGGTNGRDVMRSGSGIDTLWGDGGNDRLEGGADNDSLNGGDGNDIITDSFGNDVIKGGDGHDTINGGPGLNLIFGGAGSDFVVTGNDSSEVFAGPGNDFLFGNNANAAMIGNTGDDWIQNGTAGGAVGDNNDPLGRDPVRGNDVFVGGGNVDDFRGEGGDDIMSGLAGQNSTDGASGFDWAISDGRTTANDIDLARLVLPGPFVPIVDRYNFVEAASGWNFNDIIRGDDKTFLELELIDPITGQNNALDDVNGIGQVGHSAADRIALITGLSAVLGGANAFSAGNILLGGGGSDTFEGRAGDDILDGDAWLDIRIKADNGVNSPVFYENMTSALRTAMQNGVYSPDQLSIVREIKTTASVGDVALYQGNWVDYLVTGSSAGGPNGTVFVDHVNPGNGGGAGNDDGSDTLRNIERLQFLDRVAFIGTSGVNNLVGTAAVDTLYGFAGDDTLNGAGGADNLFGGTGNDTYVVNNAVTISELASGGTADKVESTITITLANNVENLTLLGAALNGTGNVGNNIITGNGNNNTLSGLAGNDTLNGLGGVDTLIGGTGNDTYVVDTTTDIITEAAGGGTDTVESTITITLANNVENLTLLGAALNGTGNVGNNIITGNGNNNILSGLGAADTLNGGDGDDILIGGTGIDNLTGGNGADTFTYNTTGESTPGGRDTITDFLSGTDKINLNAIDANTGAGGNQDFVFIGNAAFSGSAQVRYDSATGILQANVNPTLGADFEILLTAAPVLVVTDIIL